MNRYLPLTLLIILVIAFRCLGSVFSETMPNFQPLCALFFCGAMVFSSAWRACALPLVLWVVTYPVPAIIEGNTSYLVPGEISVTLLAFIATFFLGKSLRETSLMPALLGSAAAALLFHLITNGAAWIGDPVYAKTFEGLLESLWFGSAGSPLPSWVFLRNMMFANLLFTAIFLSTRFAIPAFFPKNQRTFAR